MSEYTLAIDQLNTADIPATTYRTGRKLLDLADKTTGHIQITRTTLLDLAAVGSEATARSHLSQLSTLGIIHYSVNQNVYVNFRAWSPITRAQRAQNGSERAPGGVIFEDDSDLDSDSDSGARKDGLSARKMGLSARKDGLSARETPRDLRDWEGGNIDPLPNSDQSLPPVELPTTETAPDELTENQQLAVKLLTDREIGISRPNAIKAARRHGFAGTVRMVATWWPQRERVGVGGLFYRLMNPKGFPSTAPGREFLTSDVWKRHYPLDESGIRRRRYAIDLAPDPLLDSLPMPIYEEGGPRHE